MITVRMFAMLVASVCIAACSGADSESGVHAADTEVFDMIGSSETIRLTGTEPFWGGEVRGDQLRYSTMENPDGTRILVERFAGNNGLSYSGELGGESFDLAITPGECSDGMSDRIYPFHAVLAIGEDTREGCAWSDANAFAEPVQQ